MEITILITSLFFILFLIGYAFYSKKAVFLNIPASLMLIVIATAIVSQGISIDHVTGYGFVANNSTSLVGAVKTTVIYNDIFVTGIGTFLAILGLTVFSLSAYYFRKGTVEEEVED
jgi:ABC-type transport system involved in multi-copper enzyme maturation permease subunit